MDRIENNRQFLFTTRKTENTDTHDYIKNHDPDYYKNKNKDPKHAWDDHEDDMAEISIESIIIFLEGLKKTPADNHKNENDHIDQSMKKAISAYGAQKPKAEKRYTYLDDETQDIDIALVDNLIISLQGFIEEGFDHIKLIPASGFLESIQKTVEKIQGL